MTTLSNQDRFTNAAFIFTNDNIGITVYSDIDNQTVKALYDEIILSTTTIAAYNTALDGDGTALSLLAEFAKLRLNSETKVLLVFARKNTGRGIMLSYFIPSALTIKIIKDEISKNRRDVIETMALLELAWYINQDRRLLDTIPDGKTKQLILYVLDKHYSSDSE